MTEAEVPQTTTEEALPLGRVSGHHPIVDGPDVLTVVRDDVGLRFEFSKHSDFMDIGPSEPDGPGSYEGHRLPPGTPFDLGALAAAADQWIADNRHLL